jgi:hypothetical protein
LDDLRRNWFTQWLGQLIYFDMINLAVRPTSRETLPAMRAQFIVHSNYRVSGTQNTNIMSILNYYSQFVNEH